MDRRISRWAAFGPIGALLGYFVGAALDRKIEDYSRQISGGSSGSGSSGGYSRDTGGYGRTGGSRGYTAQEQRNSFIMSLLVLSSAVIRADGKTLQSELDYVREFVRQNFGAGVVDDAMRALNELNGKQVNIYSVGQQIASNMNYSQRLQLFHYLAQLAQADGEFSESEKSVLEAIGSTIGLTSADVSSIIAMFYKEEDSAYAVLGISSPATDDEVRTAYRRMAMKYHPDKVATLGPEVQKAAAEKFRQIQEAYETIKRKRGIS